MGQRRSINMEIITGGVTAAKGFKAAAAAAEIKYKGRTDMAMVYSEVPCVAAGTFTTNVVKAAPVKWDQNVVYNHPSAQAVICNSGIANACTGAEGYGYCKATADAASEILGIPADSVLVASTGVIGMQIPIDRIVNGYVVDFLYFKLIDFPVFNVADCYVTIACALLIIFCVFVINDKEFNAIFSLKKDDSEDKKDK